MERKYNIVICPEYDMPLNKLSESGVKFCEEELSGLEKVGVPNYLFDVHMIMRNIPIDIVTWLWHKGRNGMDTVKWLGKARAKDYLKDTLERAFGPLCDVAIENLETVCEAFEYIYGEVKKDGERHFVEALNKVHEQALEDMEGLISCFVNHGYLSQQDYLEREYPMAFRVVNAPKLGTVEMADLLFFYKEGEYSEEEANNDIGIFCKFFEVSARMLYCHKQDEDDDLPHGQLS